MSQSTFVDYNIHPVTKMSPVKSVDTDFTLYNNIIDANLASRFDLSALLSFEQSASSRNDLYNMIDTMCQDGNISAVVETCAEDSTEKGSSGSTVWVDSDDTQVLNHITYLLNTLDIDKHIYSWAYSLCKYGDIYIRLYRKSDYIDAFSKKETKKQSKLNESKESVNEDLKIIAFKPSDKFAGYAEMVRNPATMFELTKFGKTVGYIKAPISGGTVSNSEQLGISTYMYKFKKNDVDLFPATEFVHGCLPNYNNRIEETVQIVLGNESNSTEYSVRSGTSMLADSYQTWRNLQLLEGAVLLNRVTKSSILRLINVEVGDMPKENVSKVMQSVKSTIEQKLAMNQNNGIRDYASAGPVENTIYMPTHNGVGAITTTEIGGSDTGTKDLRDLEYYQTKLYGQLKVPKQYFGLTDDAAGFSGGQSLSIISSRYAKTVKMVQSVLTQVITDLINLLLLDSGLDSYIGKFKIRMQEPTTQEEIDRREAKQNELNQISDIMNLMDSIEDETVKLKILKALLSNSISTPEVLELIQEEIERKEQSEPEDEDVDTEKTDLGNEDSDLMSEITGEGESEFSSNEVEEVPQSEEPEEEIKEKGTTRLPNVDEIDVDIDSM